jgi:hypothetical protein
MYCTGHKPSCRCVMTFIAQVIVAAQRVQASKPAALPVPVRSPAPGILSAALFRTGLQIAVRVWESWQMSGLYEIFSTGATLSSS